MHMTTAQLKMSVQTALSALAGLGEQLTNPETYTTGSLEQFLSNVDKVVGKLPKESLQ